MNNIEPIVKEKDLIHRIEWLISLRWFAATGVLIIITVSKYLLSFELSFFYLYLGNAILFFYNYVFYCFNRRLNKQQDISRLFKRAHYLANAQISLDLIMLTYFIHLSGGPENPLSFYFIFHMVIASIILSDRAAYLQATLAIFLLGFVNVGEYAGFLNHYHLGIFISEERCLLDYKYFASTFIIFVSTLYITVYFATSIVNELREGEVELEKANEKLEEQDRLKSKYVQTVSHDIQASLSTIQNCLKVVLNGLTGSISGKSREMITRAEQRSRKLINFVKELLNLSRMRAANKIDKKDLQLSILIKNIVERLNPLMEKKDLTLTVKNSVGDSLIYADEYMMEELFDNLIINALRYTPKGGEITIRFNESKIFGLIQVSIIDTGIGIQKEDLPHVFDDFYRAKNAKAIEQDGTGLGLAIVKHIFELHGGKIYIESEVGKGSTFVFTLPKKIGTSES